MAKSQHFRKVGAHSNQETRPGDSSSSKPTVAPDSQPPPTGRKRKHKTLSSRHQDSQSKLVNQTEPQAKRQRTSSCSSSNYSTNSASINSSWLSWDRAERSYWDSLSQLRLTPSSLRELNRRNALLRTKAPQTRDITVGYVQNHINITHFARRGGPDLSDIRQVCLFSPFEMSFH